ncbi:MAG TPA: hypothetical protein VMU33_11800 [Burkholderiaceae bacterium]|nr:hypothetical protein [Burkholderiaceae bacterium]
MPETSPGGYGARPAVAADQAATLRRLFGGTGPRMLPIVIPGSVDDDRVGLLAGFAAAVARQQGTTLALDAARLHLASSLGVSLRRDLADVLARHASLDAALAPAAPRLAVASAARALAGGAAGPAPRLDRVLAGAGIDAARYDWILAFIGIRALACLRGLPSSHADDGEVLVAVRPTARSLDAALAVVRAGQAAADMRVFRLLFLGMDRSAAGTLFERMAALRPGGRHVELRFGGVLNGPAGAERVAAAACGWDLTRIAATGAGADLEMVS